MSKLVNRSNLVRFWTKVKTYIDNLFNGHTSNADIHVTAAQKTAWDGKAAGDHTHTQYAASNHTHTQYAATSHGHSYNDLTDLPTIPAAYTHPTSHPASMITGLATVATSGKYSDLSGKPTIPTTVAQLSDAGDYAKKSDIANVYKYQGNKATVADLPTTGNVIGHVWNVEADGMNYGWTGTEWDNLGATFSIETLTDAEIDSIFA